MKRQFQIRITSEDQDYEDCLCFDSLAESNAAYQGFLTDLPEENEYYIEQVEVLRQHHLKPKESPCSSP